MIKKSIIHTLYAAAISFIAISCVNDLEVEPEYEVTSVSVYKDFSNYQNVLAKLYAGLILTGQQGPTGDPDISATDEGAYSYIRAYWSVQELPTDEAVVGWTDEGVQSLNTATWTPANTALVAMYDRIYYQIALSNEFIRETSDGKLAERGITGDDAETARLYRAEARFLRALSYWHALDLFGNVPFVTEEDGVGSYFPEQIAREDLFDYVESELLAVVDELVPPMQNVYGRVDQAAAWTLLTKLYLNAEVYTGVPMYTEAITYAEKVIGAGYVLEDDYEDLFMADNHEAEGIIFAIPSDGVNSKSYGGATFLINASVQGDITSEGLMEEIFGVQGGWGGLRTTEAFVSLFPDVVGEIDDRAMFYQEGQTLEITNLLEYREGYIVTKFKNLTSEGEPGSDPAGQFVDTDFPLFRLADVYLMYAEAVARGGSGGDIGTAVTLINALRERAYDSEEGNITAADLNGAEGLLFILNERGRELYWEAQRRTDLIRYGLFTGAEFLWPWKGGVMEGATIPEEYSLYPIPTTDLVANPNLVQNEGYN